MEEVTPQPPTTGPEFSLLIYFPIFFRRQWAKPVIVRGHRLKKDNS